MTFTITHPDGSKTTEEHDASYYDVDSQTVYSNDRQRLMPRIAKRIIPRGFFPTGVFCQGSLVIDDDAPPELEDAEPVEFTVRDETGGKCKVYARRERETA